MAFRIDILVENRLILEIKAVEQLTTAHERQLLTYLRLFQQPVGLLLNFSGAKLTDGIKRMVNDYRPEVNSSASPASSALSARNQNRKTI